MPDEHNQPSNSRIGGEEADQRPNGGVDAASAGQVPNAGAGPAAPGQPVNTSAGAGRAGQPPAETGAARPGQPANPGAGAGGAVNAGVGATGAPGQPANAGVGGVVQPPQAQISASSAGDVKDVKLDAIGKAGMQLATGVGLLIALVTVMLVAHWIVTAPSIGTPSDLASKKPEDATALVTNVKTMTDLAADRAIKLFDAVVSRALLPVFTAILGYIFGSRTGNRAQ